MLQPASAARLHPPLSEQGLEGHQARARPMVSTGSNGQRISSSERTLLRPRELVRSQVSCREPPSTHADQHPERLWRFNSGRTESLNVPAAAIMASLAALAANLNRSA